MTAVPELVVADCGSGPVGYRCWDGPDEMTFVCVHSLMGASQEWQSVAPALSELGRVLAMDLPGFGSTPLGRRPPTVETCRRTVSQFIAARTDTPVVLLGSSLGGLVAASVAADDPELVRALVLGSSYLPPSFGRWRAPAVIAALLTEKAALAASVGRARLLRHGLVSPGPGPLAGIYGEGWARWAAAAALIAEMAALSAVPGAADHRFDRVRCPVLVLHGDEDQLVPVEWAYWAAQKRPGWRVETLRSVGHVVKAGAGGWWVATVEDWLTGIPDRPAVPIRS